MQAALGSYWVRRFSLDSFCFQETSMGSRDWLYGLQNEVTFVMVDANRQELTGLTLSVEVRNVGGSFQAASGAWAEISDGWYKYTSSVGEASVLGPVSLRVNAAGAEQQNLEYVVESRAVGVKFYTYRVTDQPAGAGNPIAGAYVWVTLTDVENDPAIWTGYSDSNGYAKDSANRNPLVPLGNVYFWKYLPGYTDDDNPDLEVVT
jgi:hypothetical protein